MALAMGSDVLMNGLQEGRRAPKWCWAQRGADLVTSPDHDEPRGAPGLKAFGRFILLLRGLFAQYRTQAGRATHGSLRAP